MIHRIYYSVIWIKRDYYKHILTTAGYLAYLGNIITFSNNCLAHVSNKNGLNNHLIYNHSAVTVLDTENH